MYIYLKRLRKVKDPKKKKSRPRIEEIKVESLSPSRLPALPDPDDEIIESVFADSNYMAEELTELSEANIQGLIHSELTEDYNPEEDMAPQMTEILLEAELPTAPPAQPQPKSPAIAGSPLKGAHIYLQKLKKVKRPKNKAKHKLQANEQTLKQFLAKQKR